VVEGRGYRGREDIIYIGLLGGLVGDDLHTLGLWAMVIGLGMPARSRAYGAPILAM